MQKNSKKLLNYKQQDAHEFWLNLMQSMGNKANCSIFPKLFQHNVITNVICAHCDKSSQTKRIYCGHVLDFQGLRSIREAIDAYFRAEIIESYTCEHCKRINKNEATKENVLENAPKVLYLVLNRFKSRLNKILNNIELDPQLYLNRSIEKSPVKYKLASIINHIGSNISEGHYTAVACCPDKIFYEFNDSHVNKISTPIGCNAYLLMYELSTEVFCCNQIEVSV